jgi:hypothetical protein
MILQIILGGLPGQFISSHKIVRKSGLYVTSNLFSKSSSDVDVIQEKGVEMKTNAEIPQKLIVEFCVKRLTS